MQFGSTLLTVCHDHVTYEFQSESTLVCLNVKELMWSYKHHFYFKLVTGEIFGKKKKKEKMKKNLYFKFVDSEKLLV